MKIISLISFLQFAFLSKSQTIKSYDTIPTYFFNAKLVVEPLDGGLTIFEKENLPTFKICDIERYK